MKLKSAVKVTDSKLHPHTYVAGSLRDVEHDAAAAHALMQAMREGDEAAGKDISWWTRTRASALMKQWGFDSAEVEG